MLPLRPILIGCTLNTAFYGWLVWLAATMPRRISEMKRIVRGQATGLCPDCGYDMQGNPDSGCPECGWRRES